jgi:hypothetical protein
MAEPPRVGPRDSHVRALIALGDFPDREILEVIALLCSYITGPNSAGLKGNAL